MLHELTNYSVVSFLDDVDQQLEENLIARMDAEFDQTLLEPDHKKRSKLIKEHNRNVKEVSPISDIIYPMMIKLCRLRTNMLFILQNACYNKTYGAVARHLAEYEFFAKEIKKECNRSKNPVIKSFLERSTVLNENYFDLMLKTVEEMQQCVRNRMSVLPDSYIDLDVQQDSDIDFDSLKDEFKFTLKKLKEDKKKQEKNRVG